MRAILEWQELKKIAKLKELEIKPPRGIYLWGFIQNNKFIPYYVGKGNNIYQRLCDHYSRLLGGTYTVYNKDCLSEFYKYRKDPNPDWKTFNNIGRVYNADPYYKIIEFNKHRDNPNTLKPHLDNMIDNFCFTYSIHNSANLTELEKALITFIGKNKLQNMRCGIPKQYKIKNSGNEWVVNEIERWIKR